MARAIGVRSLPEVEAAVTPGSGVAEGPAVAGAADGDPTATGSVARFDSTGAGLVTGGGMAELLVVAGGLVA